LIVIPAIDVRGGRVVRLRRGRADDETVYADDPAEVATGFAAEGASWIHVVDLDAALGQGGNEDVIRAVLAASRASVQLGGGLRTPAAVDEAIGAGAARVVLGTEAVTDEAFLPRAVAAHGDRVVVALDVDGDRVRIRGWTEDAGPIGESLPRLEASGAPRFLVTSVSRDGTLEGPDLALYERLTTAASRPILASGGVRHADDLRSLMATGVEGVVVGRALYEGTLSVAEALEAVA
jgi:phosphoribosylformimino-5-aminoimidazole carboxamide ribotide isomerase